MTIYHFLQNGIRSVGINLNMCNVCSCGSSGCSACRAAWLSDQRINLEKMYRWMNDLKLRDSIIERQMNLWKELLE